MGLVGENIDVRKTNVIWLEMEMKCHTQLLSSNERKTDSIIHFKNKICNLESSDVWFSSFRTKKKRSLNITNLFFFVADGLKE